MHNGSSLFTGDAGQGESNIRRWIIESDWLEAIVALPLNMFYNTGIATYIWVLTNRKPAHRQGRVQLIDATQWFKPLRKNLGKKNCELADEDIERICDTFLAFDQAAETEQSKIFPNAAFGYWKVTVERPLRIKGIDPERAYTAKEVRELKATGEVSEDAPPVIRKIHRKGTAADPLRGLFEATIGGKPAVVEYEPDSDLRDTEQVPLLEEGGIEAFLRREVLPHAADAWYVPDSVKTGYEISFTRYFYKPQPLRTLEEIRADILALEKETEGLLGEIIGERRMKATEAKLLDFLKKSPQFVIPIYQRTYSWTERECRQLWDDILRTGSNDDIAAHFVGSIVYIEKGLYQVSSQSPLLVIDGQQRLTTVMLILEALARRLGDAEPVDGFSARKLRNYYLLNPLEEGERGFKLLLTQTDKHSLLALMQQKPQPAEPSLRIDRELRVLRGAGRRRSATTSTPLCKGLAKLVIVDIALSRDQDNPQLIFESMNSTGRELSQADLIRNFILMGLEPDQADAALRGPLAADGGRLRPGGLREPLRRLHAPLPDAQDRRDPQRQGGLRGVQGPRPHARGR